MALEVHGLAQYLTEQSLREHLLTNSERMSNGCLEFRANTAYPYAYQRISIRAWAHVAAYAVFVGPIDRSMVIDHICENPPCIEPTHLRQVTHAENAARRRGRKPSSSRCTHERATDPVSGKLLPCKPCNADAQRRWRERRSHTRSREDA